MKNDLRNKIRVRSQNKNKTVELTTPNRINTVKSIQLEFDKAK